MPAPPRRFSTQASGEVTVYSSKPGEAVMVESPEQWRWSSFRDYAYGEFGSVRVNDWTVLKMKVRRT